MAEGVPIVLKSVPIVRRVEYLEAYLDGVNRGYEKRELEAAIGERKKAFEFEKNLALGRGKPFKKRITEAVRLQAFCLSLSRDLRFVEKTGSEESCREHGFAGINSEEA